MGRVNFEDLDKYNRGGSNNAPKRFSLKDDGDVAQIRFLLEDPEDLNLYLVNTHKIKRDAKAKFPNKNVNCLRDYNDKLDKCPFCAAGMSSSVKLFLPIYNLDTGEFQFWERSHSFLSKITKRMEKYPDFPSHIFEVEREGESGDRSTTYTLSEVDEDEMTLADILEELGLEDVPDVIESGFIWDKTAEDMDYFLDEGEFPRTANSDDDEPVKRRTSKKKSRRDDDDDDYETDDEVENDEEEERPRSRRSNTKSSGRNVSARENRKKRRNVEDEF